MNKLIELESGNDYSAQSGVLPEGSTHAGATAMGRYQIMHRESIDWGCIPTRTPGTGQGTVLTAAEVNTFLNDHAAQDACFRTGIEEKYRILVANGLENGGGGYDCGALLGTAWLGDPIKVTQGRCVSDALATNYTTCDRANQMQGVCSGGEPGEPRVPYPGRAALIGCDIDVLNNTQAAVDAFQQHQIETAKAIITEPMSIEQMTCLDQQLESMNQITGKGLGNPTGSIASEVQQPFAQDLAAKLSAGDIAGSINAVFNSFSSDLMGSFASSLGGGGSTVCDATENAWLINQCIEMPKLPSLGSILDGKIGELAGATGDLASSPERLIEQACKGISGMLGDSLNDATSKFENAAGASLSPLVDKIESVTP